MATGEAGFSVDEEPLRQCVLKAYHVTRDAGGTSARLMASVRELLSGPEGGPSRASYFFEEAPDESLTRWMAELEGVRRGFARLICGPLLEALEAQEGTRVELAPNLSLYVASLAGPIAVRSSVDETVVGALVASAILVLSRLGKETVEKHLPAK